MPILQKTQLGWIIAGDLSLPRVKSNSTVNYFSTYNSSEDIDDSLTRFWNIEEINDVIKLSETEQYCEDHFKTTTKRDASGRFIVNIPFNELVSKLGDSKQTAINRFLSLERKLLANLELRRDYISFMSEYESLGHMTEIKETKNEINYFLPHHAVIKDKSLTTKLRVVFDASAKTDTGISLNDAQFVGPNIQRDIVTILLRFRKHNIVIAADISKMYRQVQVTPEQRFLQQIIWRANPDDNLKTYQLNTVTYGTASAPYLAIRCLHQIYMENKDKYPTASKVIKDDFYVDDLLTGANLVDEVLKIQHDVTKLLDEAGFELRKWLSNNSNILQQFHMNKQLNSSTINLGENEQNKTLGVFWNANTDSLHYSTSNMLQHNMVTKRIILSTISQLYDPLGLLGPIIITAKLIIQELWKINLTWDETVPQHIHSRWIQFKNGLNSLSQLTIPRQILLPNYSQIELHGFSDASEKAYGACIYIRCVSESGNISSHLACAKSRVAPIKQVTLPRLELCGALLLAKLSRKVVESLEIKFDTKYFWSDSTITLSWIQGSPNRWKTFVGNRVGVIQTLTKVKQWHHVQSAENPADLLSRGTTTDIITSSRLWWHGPQWLTRDSSEWVIKDDIEQENLPDQRTIVNMSVNSELLIPSNLDIFTRFSAVTKLQRVVAYIIRFTKNSRLPQNQRQLGSLILLEIQCAMNTLIKIAQKTHFPQEYACLEKHKPIHNKSKLLSLTPFMDHNGLLRVGGRIMNSQTTFDKKHPILIPHKHILTSLIAKFEHERLFHCGAQNLLCSIRETYWPISGRNLCKNIIRKCTVCFKANPKSTQPLMGNLPAVRVNKYAPFFNVGIDYGGPYLLKDKRTRGCKFYKAYICVFVCMATRAVHLELITDLSTDAFIAALKRFVARRGRPSEIFSDNGSNFVGANHNLKEVFQFVNLNSDKISNFLSFEGIKWHFIPANSPSFGGIWEAGIKITKYHLLRVVGNANLVFEDFYTILVQIEAILNSRPLIPLSSDPEDLQALTPGHFLIGRQLTAIPEPNLTDVPSNRLSRFEHLQSICQHFWARWHKEVISEMQQRIKWKQNATHLLKEGSLVLVKDDNLPPLKWQLGRVIDVHPGADQVIRVVTLKTQSGVLKRAVSRVCALPID